MKRLIPLLLTALLLAACTSAPPQKGEIKPRTATYQNPVFEPKSSIPAEASDPMTLKYNGEYYTYVTGGVCGVLHSRDLMTWEYLGPVVSDTASCWAPDVVYKNGTFYMYAATTKWGQNEPDRRVRLYTASQPQGPFTYQTDVTDHYSYDGHHFRASNGKEYLFWTRECLMSGVSPCSGNPNLVDTLTDMTKLGGKPALVGTPFDWECKGRCIFEAPQVLERDGRFYQLYSGGAYENETYGSGYSVNTVVMGPDGLSDYSWRKMNQILKSAPGDVSGPGGSSWVKAPNNLEDWIVYHGRNKRQTGGLGRWLRIDPVMWGVDRFWMPGAPTYKGGQPGPAQPRFRDLFDRDAMGPDWETTGTWQIRNNQASAEGDSRALLKEAAHHYLVEANLGLKSGVAGVYAYYADENNWLQALLRPSDNSLVLKSRVNGKDQEDRVHALPGAPRLEHFHQLLVRRNGDTFSVALDGLPVAQVNLTFKEPGRAGLVTRQSQATFDGVAVTHGWEDLATFPGWSNGAWKVEEGALVQPSAKGRSETFKGSRDWGSYQFTVTLQPLDPGAANAKYGIYAGYWDSRNFVEWLLDPTGAKAILRATISGKKEKEEQIPLADLTPKGLDFTKPHTLRVVKTGYNFRFEVDGLLLAERTYALATGQPGLITVDGAARFDSIQAVRWD